HAPPTSEIYTLSLHDALPIFVREGLRAVLETQPDFEVIGTPEQAASGDEALRLAQELQPDILLLDLEMPVMDGVETIRRLRQQRSEEHTSELQSRGHLVCRLL